MIVVAIEDDVVFFCIAKLIVAEVIGGVHECHRRETLRLLCDYRQITCITLNKSGFWYAAIFFRVFNKLVGANINALFGCKS